MKAIEQTVEQLKAEIAQRQELLAMLDQCYGCLTGTAPVAASVPAGWEKEAVELSRMTAPRRRTLTLEAADQGAKAGKKAAPKAKVSGRKNGLAGKVREVLERVSGPFDAHGVMLLMDGPRDFKAVNSALWRMTTTGAIKVHVPGVSGRPAVYVKKGGESEARAGAKADRAAGPALQPAAGAEKGDGKQTAAELVWGVVRDEKTPYTTRLVLDTLVERVPEQKKKITEGIYHAMDQLEAMGRIERSEENGVKGWRTIKPE